MVLLTSAVILESVYLELWFYLKFDAAYEPCIYVYFIPIGNFTNVFKGASVTP